MRIRSILVFVAVFQTVMLAVHFFLYETWVYSPDGAAETSCGLRLGAGVLSVSFLAASLLAFRYSNALLRAFYRVAAVWLGMVSFLFFAAFLREVTFWPGRRGGVYAM